jgi:hypothetical protein
VELISVPIVSDAEAFSILVPKLNPDPGNELGNLNENAADPTALFTIEVGSNPYRDVADAAVSTPLDP